VSLLVLGGGPAGSAAALTALARGIPVTILGGARFPRYRPGESLHPGIEPLLDRLGALPSILEANYLRHEGRWVDWAGTTGFVGFGEDARGPWRGFQAPRADFDARLLSIAVQNGATVFCRRPARSVRVEGHRVVGVETLEGPLHARLTIDCTGDARWLSRQLGLRVRHRSPRLLARFGYATGRVAGRDHLPLIRAERRGWTWIAEVEPGRFHWARVTAPSDRPARHWVPAELRDATHETSRGADVSWRIASRTAGPGWFLAGDAAAALDPCASHGVLRAIMTGMMVGHLVSRVLRGHATERACARAYHQWLGTWFESDALRLGEIYREAGLFEFGPSPRARDAQAPRRSQ
jgi:flavin-dependent dehydrogenase